MVLRRVGRRVGIDRNPLRRTVDRFQAAFTVVLVAAFLVAGPILAWCAGTAAYRDARHHVDRAGVEQFRVDAVVGRNAVAYYSIADGGGAWHLPVPARWTAPDGTPRTGTIVSDSTRAGTVATVWTDRTGNVISGPPSADAAARGFGAGFGTMVGVAGLFTCCWLIVVGLLERRRLARWRTAWLQVEPQWSGRR